MYGNTTMSWSSKKEAVVALTSYETGYIAASMAAYQAQWINMIMLGTNLENGIVD